MSTNEERRNVKQEIDRADFESMSPYEQGRLLLDLAKGEGRSIDELSERAGITAGTVSRLKRLAECYAELPSGWQQDLNTRRVGRHRARTAIKYSHWSTIHAYYGKGGVKREVFELLEQAHAERWTAQRLKSEAARLQGLSADAMPEPVAVVVQEREEDPTVWLAALRHVLMAKQDLDKACLRIPRSSAELTRLLVDAGDGLTTIEQVVRQLNRDALLKSDEATLNANC